MLGALSVRPTLGGPPITPRKILRHSQMRNPDKDSPTGDRISTAWSRHRRATASTTSRVPPVKKLLTLECYVNTAGGPLIFTTPFEGAPLSALFQRPASSRRRRRRASRPATAIPRFPPARELRRPETMLVRESGDEAVPSAARQPLTRLFIPAPAATTTRNG